MKFCFLLNSYLCTAYLDEPLPDLGEVAAGLHGDDAEMVLLVHPHQEPFVVGEEDAATRRPVVVAVSVAQYAVTRKAEIGII